MTVVLKGSPYLVAYDVTTGLHPILVELDTNNDESALNHFKTQYASKHSAKLYKLLQNNEKT